MKKVLLFLFAGALLTCVSCTDQLEALEKRIAELERRMEILENTVSALNTNAQALKTSVDALQSNVYVTEVKQTDNGYKIIFSNGKEAEITNGADGHDGTTPTIGVTEIEGVGVVWTINGVPIKIGDQYVSVTATAEVPEFKYDSETNTWYYRIGSGEWIEAGKGSGCTCSIIDGTDTVTITIGGTTVVLPKAPVAPTDLSKTGTANCYIVKEAGKYSIKPVKGNTSDSVGEVASAVVLWETVNTSSAPVGGSIVTDIKVEDGLVVFTVPTPFTEGNALIAVKNAGGEILWSWHIWVTADEIGQVVMANNAGTLMDRYLGAIGNTPGDTRARGMFYQWGRKDPFMGLASFGEAPFVRYALAGTAEKQKATGNDVTIAYSIAHPTEWIQRDTKNNDWLPSGDGTTDDTRWAKDAKAKTVYDPCPAGWQVPGNGLVFKNAGLEGALTSGVTFDEAKGGVTIGAPYCTPDSWWPTTGQYANGGIRGVNNYFPHQYGGTWTGCTVGMSGGSNNASRVSMFRLTDKKFFPNENTYKQFGQAVRCRKI